jgi:hydroxymethylglutaryl-CoA synthase
LYADVAKELGDFTFNAKNSKILAKKFELEWKDKCERSLKLAKMLGNIYTGSLYNGLITLLHDNTIDLAGKKVLLFSYGSGCASSMFFVHVKPGYKEHPLILNSHFEQRLNSRVKISAD